MIYINNERHTFTKTEIESFNSKFADYLDSTGRMIKPVVIKYIPELIQKDPDNPGKYKMPRSKSLSFVTQTMYNKQQSEIRYSSAPARINPKSGELVFANTAMSIFDGYFATTDKDLVWFFSEYSEQNAGNHLHKGKHSAWFVIEDRGLEQKKEAEIRKEKATIDARLWNDVGDGGLSDEEIRRVAKSLMIPGVDNMELIGDVKAVLERVIFNPKDPSVKAEFLRVSDVRNKSNPEMVERKYLIQKALDMAIIGQDHKSSKFYFLDENKKNVGQPIMSYTKKDKDPKVSLYLQLETTNKELLDLIEEKVKLAEEVDSTDVE